MKGSGILTWTAILALAVFGAAGCGGGFSQRTASDSGEKVLRYPINTNPTSFDPGITQDGDTLDLIQNVYEGLVAWGTDNLVQPLLAESWEVSPDGLTYTFKVRKGVKFHSGREVTAEDFKWTIERNTDPALASQTADAYLSDIVGVTEKVKGQAEEVEGWQAPDPETVVITLKKPTPYFLGKLTYLVSAVLDKDAAPVGKEITEVAQMVGTGPFKVADYQRDLVTRLEAFDGYHGGRPKLDAILRPVVEDVQSKLTKFEAGELDFTMLQRQQIDAVEADEKLKPLLKYFDRPAVWYLGFGQSAYAPFKDKRVRQAFTMAIDRKTIVEDLLGGHNTLANGIVPPGVQGHRPDAQGLPFDAAKAKALLAEAGYPGGKGLPPLRLFFREQFRDIQLVAEAVQENLKTNLGVEVQLNALEWRTYLDKYNKGELPFYHMRWAADFLDAQNFLSHMLATTGPENKFGYSNPEFDRLCAEADSLMAWENRGPLYARAEDIALQDSAWAPIYYQRDAELHRPEIQGMRESLFGHLPHTTTDVAAAP